MSLITGLRLCARNGSFLLQREAQSALFYKASIESHVKCISDHHRSSYLLNQKGTNTYQYNTYRSFSPISGYIKRSHNEGQILTTIHHSSNCAKPPSVQRYFSSDSKDSSSSADDEKDMTVFQRFKHVYKEYGKTLIGVHVVTSLMWYGGFYVIARRYVIGALYWLVHSSE